MCECSKVHLFEVEFKLDGMTVISFQETLLAFFNSRGVVASAGNELLESKGTAIN